MEVNLTTPGLLEEVLEGCLEAVALEAEAVRERLAGRGLDTPIPVVGGRLEEWGGGGSLYAWDLPTGRYDIRPDDAVRIRCQGGEALGFVFGLEPDRRAVRVATGEWLGRRPGPGELVFDPTWLLAALSERLEEARRQPGRFHPDTALRLLGRLPPGLGVREPDRPDAAGLDPSQRAALRRVLGSDVHFVWGPPGTGKTRLLGEIAAELAAEGKVLVVATTNAAVDEAARRVAAALGPAALGENRIVRVGAEFSLTGDPSLSLEAAVNRFASGPGSGLAEEIAGLEAAVWGRRATGRGGSPSGANGRRRGVERPGAAGETNGPLSLRGRLGRLLAAARVGEDAELGGRLGRLAGELTRVALRVLEEADVVLSTFARLTVREDVAALRFDSVIVDEASTAPLPALAVAALRGARRAVAIGDFQQLPAVVVSRDPRAARWLSRDVFREAGIVPEAPPGEPALPGSRDGLCAMLDRQYRMDPAIRALVSELFYGGRLRDAAEVTRRAGAPAPLVLLDTAGLEPRVVREGGSRANPAHAEALLQLLEVLGRGGVSEVAVVTPYRLQTRRVAALARARLGPLLPGGLDVATIHRFQGREKSVVVLDTVDAPPARSWFLDERRNPDFARLLNVALSRSRDILVVVAAPEGLRRTLPPGALLNRVVERVRREGRVVDARRIAAEGPNLLPDRGTDARGMGGE